MLNCEFFKKNSNETNAFLHFDLKYGIKDNLLEVFSAH